MNWSYCPYCGSMLPKGVERCNRCHAFLPSSAQASNPQGAAGGTFLQFSLWILKTLESQMVPAPGQPRTAKHWIWLAVLTGIVTAGLVAGILAYAHMTNKPPANLPPFDAPPL